MGNRKWIWGSKKEEEGEACVSYCEKCRGAYVTVREKPNQQLIDARWRLMAGTLGVGLKKSMSRMPTLPIYPVGVHKNRV